MLVIKYILPLVFINNKKLPVMYNIIFKNGSNKIEVFNSIKDFGTWWRSCVKLGIHNAGSVVSVSKIR